jgi:hypothetical protein
MTMMLGLTQGHFSEDNWKQMEETQNGSTCDPNAWFDSRAFQKITESKQKRPK